MRKLTSLTLAAMLVLSMLLSCGSASAMGTKTFYVNTNNGTGGPLLMRSDPWVENDNVIARVPYGTKVQVAGFSEDGQWGFCSYGNAAGWVMMKFLSEYKPGPSKKTVQTPTPAPNPTNTDGDYILNFINNEFTIMAKNTLVNRYQVKVTPPKLTTKCYLRWAPHQSTRAMRSDLMYGDILTVVAEGNKWLKVIDPETDQTGFITKSLTTRVSGTTFK